MPSTVSVTGCHLVGSVPLSDTEEVYRKCVSGLPSRLKRLPDGETGNRNYFTVFQMSLFKVAPMMMVNFELNKATDAEVFSEEQIDQAVEQLKAAGINTGYDDAAKESYAVFKRLKDQSVIPKEVKFQVSLPSAANVVGPFVQAQFQPKVFPIYEEALFRAMRNIQDSIPHEELAIQLDLAVDTAYWEGVYLTPWFSDIKNFVVAYLLRMVKQVDQDVELGIHNCYGDMEHKHWHEPTSLKAVVERGLRLFQESSHPINFFHLPVPVSTMHNLDTFLEPLKDLAPKFKDHGTDVYVGVVQYNDLEGTKKRIEAVSKVLPEFGVATECGMGRTPLEQLEDIMKISCEVSKPVY